MTRFGIILVAIIVIRHCVRPVECEDKRIIIHVPRSVRTIHHHHHHVMLMDAKKPSPHAGPLLQLYLEMPSRSSSDEDRYTRQADRYGRSPRARHQFGLIGADMAVFPAAHRPVVNVPPSAFTGPPVRAKRSKQTIARRYVLRKLSYD